MANDVRGEVKLAALGKDYTLKLSTNAICKVEGELHKSIIAIMGEIDWISTRRVLLWAALQAHHADIPLETVGLLMDDAGQAKTVEALTAAFNRAFPAPTEDADRSRP